MFVKVIEPFEQFENRRESWVRAIVRLEPFDFLQHGGSESGEWAVFERNLKRGIVSDRERPSPRSLGRIRLSSDDGNGVDEVIQGAPEVVDSVADDQRLEFPWFRGHLARIDHRFGNEGDFGRLERFSESFAIDPVQVE